MEACKILVLGVGNILLRDEGVGVRVVERLERDYVFSGNVELMDGGTLGMKLLEPISQADVLIVVDAVRNGQAPGTVYRLYGEDLSKSLAFKNSLHQVSLVETLTLAELMGQSPDTVVVGMEPADMGSWGTELTETVAAQIPVMIRQVLEQIRQAGGHYQRSEERT